MGQKWIFRLKTEDFVCVAQRPNIALKEKSEGKSRALSEYYSETENDQKPVGIWTELEAANRPCATSRQWSGAQACHKHHGNQRDGSSGQIIDWKLYVKDKWVKQESRTLDPEW